MPVQAEAISGRPEEEARGLTMPGAGSALAPGVRSQIGQWQKYNEEERAISKQYQQGFSQALQAETERWQPIADEISGQLDTFWGIRREYDQNLASYPYRSRKRRRRMRDIMHSLSGKATKIESNMQRAFAKLDYRPPSWSPPEIGEQPEIGTTGLQMRDVGRPQRLATTKRPTIGTDLGAETASALPEFRRRASGIKATGLQMRGQEAATYNRLLRENADIYGDLRSSVGTEVGRAENLSWPY